MVNPTKGWDKVPVYGWYFELDGVTPKTGKILLNLSQRVNSKDGRNIFPGGTDTVTLGGTDNDTTAMNQVRSDMRAADQAAVEATGGTFDAAAWDADWDARLPAAFFTSFPASDDPDIVQAGFKVTVTEKLNTADGKMYTIQPLLSMLDTALNPIRGLNVGTVDVPPGSPTAPAPIYQKGAPGGVAPLDDTAKVPLENLPDNIGSGGSATWGSIAGQPAVIAAGATQQDARTAIDAPSTEDLGLKADTTALAAHTSNVSNPHSVTKAQVGLANADNTADADKPVSAAQAAALATKADLVNGSVPAAQLPSYVDDVVEFNTADSTGFPATGESGKIYVATQATPSPTQWRWSGSGYQQMVSSPGSTDAVPEGSVNKYFTDARAQAANAAALATRLNMRGDYVNGGVYAVNDVVNSPGFGRWRCIQAHTASGPAPNIESAYWTILGGNSNVVVGTQPGNAADVSTVVPNTRKINNKQLNADFSLAFGDVGALGAGFAGAVAGTTFEILWVVGSGWIARPTTRADIFFNFVDPFGLSGTTVPAGILAGDKITRKTATGVTTVTYRSSSVVGPNQSIDYLTTPLQLPAPAGLAVGDYYMVAVLFGAQPAGSSFIAPSGFARLTPAASSGQDFAVYGYKMATSADVSAVATSNWSPNSTAATRGQAIGVALQGVASVGTPTAISYANPITSPYTPATVTGDATFQVMYTGNTSTSSHPVHASVGGTLLAQVMAKSGATDPQSDNVLSISMNGTGVSWSPSAVYGGGTNIPVTKG